jgi:predicted nucleic acid-binding protein
VLFVGSNVSAMDLLIGTSAVVDDVALLTTKHRHVAPIPDLRLLSYRTTQGVG